MVEDILCRPLIAVVFVEVLLSVGLFGGYHIEVLAVSLVGIAQCYTGIIAEILDLVTDGHQFLSVFLRGLGGRVFRQWNEFLSQLSDTGVHGVRQH